MLMAGAYYSYDINSKRSLYLFAESNIGLVINELLRNNLIVVYPVNLINLSNSTDSPGQMNINQQNRSKTSKESRKETDTENLCKSVTSTVSCQCARQ